MTEEDHHIFRSESRPLYTLVSRVDCQWLMTSVDGYRVPRIERFSTLGHLLKTTARLRRILPLFRGNRGVVVSAEEQNLALVLHIRQAQGNTFKQDIKALVSNSGIEGRSPLLPLNPFLDENRILRVGGRLTNADMSNDQRHQIITDAPVSPTTLLAHMCAGPGKILHLEVHRMLKTSANYAAATDGVVTKAACPCCTTILPQWLGLLWPLPSWQQALSSYDKNLCSHFLCMASRAVHIELAEDLSTQAFINVYDRFVSRRGICATLYSDNGSQFIGANRQLQEDLQAWVNVYSQHLVAVGTHWKFITPSSPHHGGLWEAAVRSAKKHLTAIACFIR
ncbi:PREDICTED: uncharacterized protein LOC108364257 [Rhagoletis zephyria]|uniref:uncharacterized protein LOC108364257 n=1 Tax=Rhagoletis zephyria TaxID=28612 RepID=UPI0008113B1F|nr:PREDICTED: uncharacterized protein LOC108364257 [Rhagoletis zephyria]XP_036334821.1 uncharacterized protein LOC118745480 [Rhagoletis pomonella]